MKVVKYILETTTKKLLAKFKEYIIINLKYKLKLKNA